MQWSRKSRAIRLLSVWAVRPVQSVSSCTRVHFTFTCLLTAWCRDLLEKLTGLQLVKKFPAFYVTRRFNTTITSVRHLSLSWASPIQSTYQYPTSWRSILILSTHLHLGLPIGLFPSGFPIRPLSSPIRATCPAHLILLALYLYLTVFSLYSVTGKTSWFQRSTDFIVKVKVKWSRYRPGVAQRVGRGIALLFHDRGTRRGWVVSSTPRPHFTPGKDSVPILQEAGWARGRSGRAENFVPTGIRSRTVQPVAQSLYRLR